MVGTGGTEDEAGRTRRRSTRGILFASAKISTDRVTASDNPRALPPLADKALTGIPQTENHNDRRQRLGKEGRR